LICVKPQKINMKLKSTAFLLYLLFFSWVNAQLHPSAAFQISSTTQGFLLPQMTQSQMDNISNPADGLMIYCSDCSTGNGTYVFNAKKQIVQGNFKAVNLKKRQPYVENLWYFRITGKYRAIAERVGNKLYVFHISDHQ
jgi:hypothetical protein